MSFQVSARAVRDNVETTTTEQGAHARNRLSLGDKDVEVRL